GGSSPRAPPGPRRANNRASAEPAMPPPTITTSLTAPPSSDRNVQNTPSCLAGSRGEAGRRLGTAGRSRRPHGCAAGGDAVAEVRRDRDDTAYQAVDTNPPQPARMHRETSHPGWPGPLQVRTVGLVTAGT